MKELDLFCSQIASLTAKNSDSFNEFSFNLENYVQNIEPSMDSIQNLKTISNNIMLTWQVFENATTTLKDVAVDEIFLKENELNALNFELYCHCLYRIVEKVTQSQATGMATLFPAIHTRLQQVFQLGIDKLYLQLQAYLDTFRSIELLDAQVVEQLTKLIYFLVFAESRTKMNENKTVLDYIASRKRLCVQETSATSCCVLECTKVPYVRGSHPVHLLLAKTREIVAIEGENAASLFSFMKKLKFENEPYSPAKINSAIVEPIVKDLKSILLAILEKTKSLFEPTMLYFDSITITIDLGAVLEDKSGENSEGLLQILAPLSRQYTAFNAEIFNTFQSELEKQLADTNLGFPADASTHLLVCRTVHFCKRLAAFPESCDKLVVIGKGGKFQSISDYSERLLGSTLDKLKSNIDMAYQKQSSNADAFIIDKRYFLAIFLYNNYYYCSLKVNSEALEQKCNQLKEEVLKIFDFSSNSVQPDRYLNVIQMLRQLNLFDSEFRAQIVQLLIQSFLPQYMSFITSNAPARQGDSKKQFPKYPTYSEAELAVQRAFQMN